MMSMTCPCDIFKKTCAPNCLGNTKAIIKKWKSVESVICMIICCNVKLWEGLYDIIVKLLFLCLVK